MFHIKELEDQLLIHKNKIEELKKKIDSLSSQAQENLKQIQNLRDENKNKKSFIEKFKTEMIPMKNFYQLEYESKLSLSQLLTVQKKLEDEYMKNINNSKFNEIQTKQIKRAEKIIGKLLLAVKESNQI